MESCPTVSTASDSTSTNTKKTKDITAIHSWSLGGENLNSHLPVACLSQTWILIVKRFLIQKRDVKGAFFTILIPVLLVCLVLLVLLVDVKLAGPPISMGMELFPSSFVVITEVNNTFANTSDDMMASLAKKYTQKNYKWLDNIPSSSLVSNYLLNSDSNASHYGAFVMNDVINASIDFNWDIVWNTLDKVQSDQPPTDLISLFHRYNIIHDGDEHLYIYLSVEDVVNVFYNVTGLTTVSSREINYTVEDAVKMFYNVTNLTPDTVLPTVFNCTIEDAAKIFYDVTGITPDMVLPKGIDYAFISSILCNVVSNINASFTSDNEVPSQDLLNLVNKTSISNLYNNAISIVNASFIAENEMTSKNIFDLFTDHIEKIFTNTSTTNTTLQELFEEWNGIGFEKDDRISLEADSVLFNWSNNSIIVRNLAIGWKRNKKVYEDLVYTWPSIREVISWPEGISAYNFNIDSPVSLLHNSSSPHAVAAFHQIFTEPLFQKCTSNERAKISAINHPLPLTSEKSTEIQVILSAVASFFLLIPFCYIPSTFVVFVVKERLCKSKHVQLVSGVNMSAYWISTYTWDMFLYGILSILVSIVLLAYGHDGSAQVFVGDTTHFFCTFSLILGYGFSALPFAYLWSRYFTNPTNAQISILGIFFIKGFVALNIYYSLNFNDKTQHIASALLHLFRLFPPFNFGYGLLQLSSSFWSREIMGSNTNIFSWDLCGASLALLYGLSIIYFVLLLLLECSSDGGLKGILGKLLRCLHRNSELNVLKKRCVEKSPSGNLILNDVTTDDKDVQAESNFVLANKEKLKHTAIVFLANLWKIYPPNTGIFRSFIRMLKHSVCCCCKNETDVETKIDISLLPKEAVRGLSIAVMPGETFGLLGLNGCGKED